MNCSRFETLLTDYLDQTLDRRVHQAMSEHLESCAHCNSLVRQVQNLQEELEHFPVLEASETLIRRILEGTSGIPVSRSFWADLVLPTVRPFAGPRFAFATLVMFVFLSLTSNLWIPGFSALSASDLKPSTLAEESHRWSGELYKRWMQLREFRTRLIEELKFLGEDLYGRLDYHLITLLFKSYSESLEEQQREPKEEQGKSEPRP